VFSRFAKGRYSGATRRLPVHMDDLLVKKVLHRNAYGTRLKPCSTLSCGIPSH